MKLPSRSTYRVTEAAVLSVEPMRKILQRLHKWGRALRSAVRTASPPAYMRVAYCTPRQVVLITARSAGVTNVWPIDWHIPLSLEPEIYGVALNKASFGAEMIRTSGFFVVNFVPSTWQEAILFCGRTSGRIVDKIEAAGLRIEQAESVDAPRLTDALACLECSVDKVLDIGDHAFFIGHVLHAVYRSDAARLHHLNRDLSHIAASFERT